MKLSSLIITAATVAATSAAVLMLSCCKGEKTDDSEKGKEEKVETNIVDTKAKDELPTKEYTVEYDEASKTYLVADIDDEAAIYQESVDPAKALIVISKREYRLYVYNTESDTTLAASFPICYAKNPGQKSRQGDNSTPECTMKAPFTVSQIVNASTWNHDFGDGRGEIPSYGHWFCRLDLSKSFPDNEAVAKNRSIGIHGSTSNEPSVPGRDSEGCIRLRDADIITLHDNYIAVGTKVVVKPIDKAKYTFELKAEKALGDKYKAAKIGNPLFSNAGGDAKNANNVEESDEIIDPDDGGIG